jgi:hypothetical protein
MPITICSFDDMMKEATAHGLRVNNFCQLEDGLYRCNFRKDVASGEVWFGGCSESDNPRRAIREALDVAIYHLEKADRKGNPIKIEEPPLDLFS